MLTLRALVCLFVIEDYLCLLASSLNCISELKSQISLHLHCHCPGLSDGLPLLALERQPFHWFPSSHPSFHTLCQRELCKLSVRLHHSQLRPSAPYLLPVAPKASLADTFASYPYLLPSHSLAHCLPAIWSSGCHSTHKLTPTPGPLHLLFSLPGWLFLHQHDLYPQFIQLSAHMLPAFLERTFPITF